MLHYVCSVFLIFSYDNTYRRLARLMSHTKRNKFAIFLTESLYSYFYLVVDTCLRLDYWIKKQTKIHVGRSRCIITSTNFIIDWHKNGSWPIELMGGGARGPNIFYTNTYIIMIIIIIKRAFFDYTSTLLP